MCRSDDVLSRRNIWAQGHQAAHALGGARGRLRRAARSLGLPAVHRIGVDVMSDDWVALLQRYGFMKDRPTAWLLEGFLYYFDQPDVMRTLAAIADMSAPGSRIGMSAVSAAAASSDGGKWKWGSDPVWWPDPRHDPCSKSTGMWLSPPEQATALQQDQQRRAQGGVP